MGRAIIRTAGWQALPASGLISLIALSDAQANGEFFQLDYAPRASTVIGSVVRGPWGAALGWSDFAGGGAFSANITYSLPVAALGESAVFRFGPSARSDRAGSLDLGAKVVLERWAPTTFGSVFVLADYNTIKNEYQLLGEVAHWDSGLSAAVSIQGGDSFRENSLFLGYDIRETPVRLRLGYRFREKRAVIGFAINTF